MRRTGSRVIRLPTIISASLTHFSVCSPSITSTSFISGTGLKKWDPAKRCGVLSFAAIVVTDKEDVFVARMQSGADDSFELGEKLALRIEILDDRFDHDVASFELVESIGDLDAREAASASSRVVLPFSAARASIFATKSRASCAAPGRASVIRTFIPPAAATCTMPRPIAPVPITPTMRSDLFASSVIDCDEISAASAQGCVAPQERLVTVDRARECRAREPRRNRSCRSAGCGMIL